MRTLIILFRLTSPALAEPLGLRFGMTTDEIKAARPCAKLTEVPQRGMTCPQVRYAELDMARQRA